MGLIFCEDFLVDCHQYGGGLMNAIPHPLQCGHSVCKAAFFRGVTQLRGHAFWPPPRGLELFAEEVCSRYIRLF